MFIVSPEVILYPKPEGYKQSRPLRMITHVITDKIFMYYNFVIRHFKRKQHWVKMHTFTKPEHRLGIPADTETTATDTIANLDIAHPENRAS